jgi:hypothetical protein
MSSSSDTGDLHSKNAVKKTQFIGPRLGIPLFSGWWSVMSFWVHWLKLVANRRQILNCLKSGSSCGLLIVGVCGSEMEAFDAVVLPFGTVYLSYGPVVERSHDYPKSVLLKI